MTTQTDTARTIVRPRATELHIDATIEAMNRLGRTELVHYAGAAHRDQVAWYVTAFWLENPFMPEKMLKQRALHVVTGVWVSLGDIVA